MDRQSRQEELQKTEYDTKGNETTKTDGNGDQISYAYDDQNRVTEITQGGQKTKVSYQVNSDGSTTTSVTDANGHVKQETASASGSVTTTSDLGDGSESITTKYTYDDRGNKISEVYANGAKKTYEYNSRNLVVKTQSYDKEGTKTLISRYRYDDYGQLLEMTDYRVSSETETAYRYTEYTYDQRGRITAFAEISQNAQPTADDIKAHQIRYTYNEDGNLSKVSYPTTKDGIQSLSYIYDENGWLQEIKGELHSKGQTTEKVLRSYSYDAYGKVKEIKDYRNRLKNGAQAVQKIYTYDSFDRVKEMTYTDLETGKVMESYRYSYDKNSNITEKTEVNNYPKEEKDKVNETKAYTYDALGRLTKTVTTDHKNDDRTKTVTYTYDKAGNRTKEDDGTTQTAYTYNGLDQLQTATKEKGTAVDEVRQYSYDANGNQTDVKNTKTGQTESYTYDAENRLSKVAVTDKDGKTAVIQQNRYNGEGQRIQKVEGSKTTNYYYQDGVVSYTTDGENSQTSQNLIGTDGNILATQRYGSDHTDYLLYHKDIQGSTTSLVKEDGSADATYRYTDFGETTINGDNKAENEVCYTGGIYDHSTGLYYLNARYYNPEDGRFVTEDTYRGETAKPETGHLYAYCANNPVNYVDPSGHKAKTVIYYNKKGKGFKKQAMHSPYYKNSQVTFKSVIKKAQFKKEWDKIPKGTSELYLYLHGGVSCLYFDGSDMNLKELLALKKKKIKKKIVLLSCKGGIGDKNSVAKIMAKKCQCVVYASSYPYGLSYRYDKKKKVYYPRYGGKQNYYNHENPLKKYKP
ncbi:MAG: RHS repeat domain-containing protein [Anaerostipes hadrus]